MLKTFSLHPVYVLLRIFDRARALGIGDLPIEIRGWAREYVEPKFEYLPTVAETYTPCESHRDVYFKKVVRIYPQQTQGLTIGKTFHEVFLTPFRLIGKAELGGLTEALYEAKVKALEEVPREFLDAAKAAFDLAAKLVFDLIADGFPLPISVEPCLEGTLVGFSDVIRPDLVIASIPVEIVVGDKDIYVKRKELALAIYAMAIEALTCNPVNYGVLIMINPRTGKALMRAIPLTDDIRRQALRERDEVARIVSRKDDPGISSECPESCAYYAYCRR